MRPTSTVWNSWVLTAKISAHEFLNGHLSWKTQKSYSPTPAKVAAGIPLSSSVRLFW